MRTLLRGLAYWLYADPPKNTRIKSDPSGEMIEGSTVTLTCMSEADPPVHTYTWIKKSGAVELKSGKEKTLIFNKIHSEDRGEYLCQAANRIGQQDSPAMFIQVLCEYHCKSTRGKIHWFALVHQHKSSGCYCPNEKTIHRMKFWIQFKTNLSSAKKEAYV